MKLARLLLALLLLTVISLAAHAAGDTGTYRIESYTVTLTPHSDGKVATDYDQRWRVTGGHLPWVTVGLPNENFEITQSRHAVKSIAPDNQAGWSGVRIDLDRDYQSGQTFEISFSVSQDKLFYARGENYKLDFTPGWYDRARIDSLEVRLKSFAKTNTITANPEPTSRTDDELVWTKAGLGEGERFPISISFPKTATPAAIPEGSLRSEGGGEGESSGGSTFGILWVLIVLGIVAYVILRIMGFFGWGGRYTGGGIFWGGGPWWGGGSSDGDGGDRHTGGGGGFGGGGFSCACACVSCACACACAGGGGAGCSRKARHRCPSCEAALATDEHG